MHLQGHNEYSWGKIHDNELRMDLVDLLHLAYPAPMITEEMLTPCNLLNEFGFHVNKVTINQAA